MPCSAYPQVELADRRCIAGSHSCHVRQQTVSPPGIVPFIMLFILGYRWGVHMGTNRWKTGLLLCFFGVVLMAIAILLGG